MVKVKMEEGRFSANIGGTTSGVKAEMAYLLKSYRRFLEDRHGKKKAEIIYEETFELSHESGKEIQENFDRDFIRELREAFGAKND